MHDATPEITDASHGHRTDDGRRPWPGARWPIRFIMVAVVIAATTGVAVDGVAPDRLPFAPGPVVAGTPTDTPVVARPPVGLLGQSWLDTGDRDAVVAAYVDAFSRPAPDLAWTGRHQGCAPGDSSDELRRATLDRIAFYRAMAGVPAVIVEEPRHSALAQSAALMMSAEGSLSHHPEPDYACYTPDGQLAAANSNLYLGRTGPGAIDGYIEDPGDRNRDVGHRSTILHPPTRAMGVGHVAGSDGRHAANVLWVFDDRVFDDGTSIREPDGFVAWPPRGFVPAPIVHPRWSLALAEADFDQAEVTMTVDGRPVELDIVTRRSTVGEVPSSIVVWEPDPAAMATLVTEPLAGGMVDEVAVTVTVADVGRLPIDQAGGRADGVGDFRYQVVIIPGPDPADSVLASVLAPISRAALATLDPGLPTSRP